MKRKQATKCKKRCKQILVRLRKWNWQLLWAVSTPFTLPALFLTLSLSLSLYFPHSVCSSGFSALWFFRNAKAKICHCSFFFFSVCKSFLSPGLVLMGNLYLWLHIYYLTWRHLSSSAKVGARVRVLLAFRCVCGRWKMGVTAAESWDMYESVQVVCATEKCLSFRNSLVKFFICFPSTNN